MLSWIKKLFGTGVKTDYAKLVKEGALIIDVRSRDEFAGGHVKGAINIPLDQLSKPHEKLKDKNKAIITCCASGMRSASAKSFLKANGFSNVYNGGGWFSLQQKLIAS